jgi:hypothetical protein
MSSPQPTESLQQLLRKPLHVLDSEYFSQSRSSADLPQAWNIHAGDYVPQRLSFNQTLIADLAKDFRHFVQDVPFPFCLEVQRIYRLCAGEWEDYEKHRMVGLPGKITEKNISGLHTETIKNAISTIFHHVITHHPSCTAMRAQGVTAHSHINDEPLTSGEVDSCFVIEAPAQGDQPARTIKCCWFDDKNLAVLDKNREALEERIQGGAKLVWKRGNPDPMKLLVKAGPPSFTRDSSNPGLHLRGLTIRRNLESTSASSHLGRIFSCFG